MSRPDFIDVVDSNALTIEPITSYSLAADQVPSFPLLFVCRSTAEMVGWSRGVAFTCKDSDPPKVFHIPSCLRSFTVILVEHIAIHNNFCASQEIIAGATIYAFPASHALHPMLLYRLLFKV